VLVGRRLMQRLVQGEARDAVLLFATGGLALGANELLDTLEIVLATIGVRLLGLFTISEYVGLFLTSLALAGLVYLFMGSMRALGWGLLGYLAFFGIVLHSVSQAGIAGVDVGARSVEIQRVEPIPGSLLQGLLFLLLAPPIVGAFAHLTLLRTTEHARQRYRIGLVSTSILLWFGSVYGAVLLGVSEAAWWPVLSNGIGFAAALVIWAASIPPGWVQERLGVEPLGGCGDSDVRSKRVSG